MRRPLAEVGPAFVAMAHRIGVAVTATTGVDGRPHTRVMQPVWVGDGSSVVGWASTTTQDPKIADLRATPGNVPDLLGAQSGHLHG